MNESIEIKGKKVCLRSITRDDTRLIVKWRNTEFVRRNFIYQAPFTIDGHMHWLDTMIETGKAVQFIIIEQKMKKAIGSVYLRDINKVHHKAEFGIFIGEDSAVGKGYGTEAAELMVKYGFDKLGLHKIVLRVFAENLRAIRAYEKAGFQKEAYLRDDVCIQGEYKDIVWMEMIKN